MVFAKVWEQTDGLLQQREVSVFTRLCLVLMEMHVILKQALPEAGELNKSGFLGGYVLSSVDHLMSVEVGAHTVISFSQTCKIFPLAGFFHENYPGMTCLFVLTSVILNSNCQNREWDVTNAERVCLHQPD